MTAIGDIARATIASRQLLPAGQPVVVMVSGGADSTALLRLLASGDLGDVDLMVLHVDHMLRDDSAVDAEFVRGLAASLGVAHEIVAIDVAACAESEGLNLEDAGRQARYRLAEELLDARLAALGLRPGGGAIATAHTLDDRIETFFVRALWGAGPGGLSSIKHRRGRVVRPLLDVERADVRSYLADLGQEWREDPTNDDVSRQRSAVRHRLLPVADELNPAFRTTMHRTLELLEADSELLAGMADAFGRDFARIDPGERVEFERDLMLTLSYPMARRTVRSALLEAFPEASRIEFDHVKALVDGLADPDFARDLPYGLRAEAEYDRLVVSRTREPCPSVAPSLLTLPGKADLGDGSSIVAEFVDPLDLSGTPDSIVIDAGTADSLTVDSVREGDRMRPLGMTGTRKLSDLLVDAKVPRRTRGSVPVLRDGERVIWLAGVRMSEEVKVTPATKRAVRLTWQRRSDG